MHFCPENNLPLKKTTSRQLVMYSNAYRLERKPSEISKLRRSFLQRFNLNYKKNPTTTTTMSTTSTTPNGIYIRNVQPKRPKSPFKKFEQVALKAEATDSNYNSQLLASKKLSASESNLSFNSQSKDHFRYRWGNEIYSKPSLILIRHIF